MCDRASDLDDVTHRKESEVQGVFLGNNVHNHYLGVQIHLFLAFASDSLPIISPGMFLY